jgi:mono/diheme cytochrome c family protein
MHRGRQAILALLLTGHATVGWTLPWDQDMVDQPSQKPQESAAPAEPGSVPVTGGEFVPAPETETGMFDAKEAAVSIKNPVPATPESLERGAEFYATHCEVCHGTTGVGDGPVGQKFVAKAPVDLNDAYTQDQADGQIFFTLTRGRDKMPFYRDALSQEERWDVINYIRYEFGSP